MYLYCLGRPGTLYPLGRQTGYNVPGLPGQCGHIVPGQTGDKAGVAGFVGPDCDGAFIFATVRERFVS